MTHLKNTLLEAVAALKANKSLKVDRPKVAASVKPHVEGALKELKLGLPPGWVEQYRQADGCHVSWRAKDDSATGELFVQPLSRMMLVHWKGKLWFDWMNEPGASPADSAYFAMAKRLRGYDVMDSTQDGTLIIAVDVPEGASHDASDLRLYYWHQTSVKFPLDLSCVDYVATALDHRCMTDWHLFYILLDATTIEDAMWQKLLWSTFYTVLPRMEQFLDAHAKLFPETPMDPLRERYQRTRDFAGANGLLR